MAAAARQAEAGLWEPAGIVPGARVADVGCGPGAMLSALAGAVGPDGRVTAVDADPQAVTAATALVAAAGLGNVAVRQGRAEETGLEAWSLDVVMLRHVLAHNGGAEDAIVAHLATLVRPGGCLYLADVDATAIRTLPEQADLTDLQERYGAFRAARGDDNRAGLRLADRLARAGLEVLEFRGRYFIGQPPPSVRPPSWAAREAMVAAGVASEDDVRRWDRAFQEVQAAPVGPDDLRPPVHRRRPPAGLTRPCGPGRRSFGSGAYNRGNSQATQEATVPDNNAVTGADGPDALRALRQRWREQYAAGREREADFTTLSGEEVAPLYDPLDHPDRDVAATIGVPGQYPFTRGVYPSMYRGRPWTIRQFSGFGNARETNERYKYLIGQGGGGLSVAFDMPTLMGRDSDDPHSLGEVGHCGVAVDSVADMEILFDGLPLDELTTSMTISGPAPMLFAMYLVAAERQGATIAKLDGTLQTDIFKEYIAQKEWLFPPEPHLRLIGDLFEFCAAEVPKYHPVSVSGYHIREAGATAAQELAFTLADGFAYIELGQRRGLDVDTLGSQLSFFFDAHVDFFEEIGKFRAARRIWARWMRDRYGATSDKAMQLRFHTQTAGVSLTAQQPDNNVVRTAVEALS